MDVSFHVLIQQKSLFFIHALFLLLYSVLHNIEGKNCTLLNEEVQMPSLATSTSISAGARIKNRKKIRH
jgi:hypothetical protein